MKFRALIDPALWTEGAGAKAKGEQHLHDKVHEIKRLTRKSLHELLERHEVSDIPPGLSQCVVAEEKLKALVDYFREKRICEQMAYFEKSAKKSEKFNKYTHYVPPFYSSSVFLLRLATL